MMKIQQIYTGCIAQAAYYLESNGEAAIFDPLREVQPYIDRAEADGAKIKYIFETHFHADFVSGHLDLARKTGATIVYGPTAKPAFEAHIASDNEEFRVGNYTIKALHTPGHTLESTTFLLLDENQNPHGIITGDTLFIGDVGRPDLAQKVSDDLTSEKLAGMLFDSLRQRIMVLPDNITVYPSHGAGSACGKNMSKETTDSLGNQKKTNYALRADMSKDEFIAELLDGLAPPPAYFPQNVALNAKGYESLDTVLSASKNPLSPEAFRSAAESNEAVMLDVRHESEFVKAHIPGAVFIGLQGQFAPWAGALLGDVNQPILLIADENRVDEAITRLSRVGFDHVIGYLEGGFDRWKDSGLETDTIQSVSPETFASDTSGKPVIDARKPGEFEAEHVEGGLNFPLDSVNSNFRELPEETFYLHCAGGYRSVIMASILKARGIHNLINVEKGMAGIRQTSVPLTKFSCSSAN